MIAEEEQEINTAKEEPDINKEIKRSPENLPLEALLIIGGRAVLAVGDNLVAAIDGVNAVRYSLYYRRHSSGGKKEITSLEVGQALLSGFTTVVRSGIRYHSESNRRMKEELRYILGLGKD